jgi:hypothetical protein
MRPDHSRLRPNRSWRSETRRAHNHTSRAALHQTPLATYISDGAAHPTVTATEGYPLAPFGSGCARTAVWV